MTKERLEEMRSHELRVREGLARNPIFFHMQSEAAIAAFDDRRDLLAEIDRLRDENIELRRFLDGEKSVAEIREKSLTWCLEVEIPRLRGILVNARQVIECNRDGVTIDITEHTLKRITEALEQK